MSLIKLFRNSTIIQVTRSTLSCNNIHSSASSNAIKKLTTAKGQKAMAAAGSVTRQFLSVETDPAVLTKFVCGANVFKVIGHPLEEGKDPELKPDSEYPDWLWGLRVERSALPLEEIEPDTQRYWDRKRKDERKRIMVLMKSRRKFREFG